jgi:molybdate transport system regulatory protein
MNKPRKKSRPRPRPRPRPGELLLRGRLTVEFGKTVGLSEAGADLLEQIVISGSLSEAARRLHFSYRYAWMLVDAMNRAWSRPLVKTATGGKRGGGAQLTALGHAALAAYRHLQLEFEHFLDIQSADFKRATHGAQM